MNRSRLGYLLPNLLAGGISGLVTLTYSMSYAALIFSGDLQSLLPLGIGCALIGAATIAVVAALTSSLPFTIAGPDSNSSAILAVMAAAIAGNFLASGDPSQLASTIWLAIILSTVLTGICLFLLGRLRLGRFIRFIPYPVVGGFLAGVGWLISQGSFKVMAGLPLEWGNVTALLQPDRLVLWIPGAILAVALQIAVRRYRYLWLVPSFLLGAIALVHLVLKLAGISIAEAIRKGVLLETFSTQEFWQTRSLFSWEQVNWSVLGARTDNLMTLIVVVAITILLCATGLELATEKDVDLDRELRSAGIANTVAGLCGGMVGYLSISRSLLNFKTGASHRISGIAAGLMCAIALLVGAPLLSYLPRPVLGGLLLYIGVSLLIEWIYDAWFNLSRLDYALILAILVIVANFGFLAGVAAGVVIACLLFAINYSSLRVIRNALSGTNYHSKFERSFHEQRLLRSQGEKLSILCLQGYLFFGTANTLLSYVRQQLLADPDATVRFLVLDFRLVAGLDSSAVVSFIKMKQLARQCDVTLVFTQIAGAIENKLKKGGFLDEEAEDREPIYHIFPDLDRGVEWCESKIIEMATFRRKRFMPFVLQLEEVFPVPEKVRPFMSYLEKLRVKSGYVLFQQGEIPDALYFVESGQVSLFLELENGQTKRLGTSSAGTVVGDAGLYRRSPHPVSAIADRSSRLYRLSNEAIDKMQEENPQLAAVFHQFIARLLAERLVQATAGVEILLQ